jgi:hypothetical protein
VGRSGDRRVGRSGDRRVAHLEVQMEDLTVRLQAWAEAWVGSEPPRPGRARMGE